MSDDNMCNAPDRQDAGVTRFACDVLVPGAARAVKVILDTPLSFWGGYDSDTGVIVDRGHPQCGLSLGGKIMVMAHAKGSSSSSSVLAEAIRNGTGPCGIVLQERDLIVSIGVIAAVELYDVEVPVVCLDAEAFRQVRLSDGAVRINARYGVEGAAVEIFKP